MTCVFSVEWSVQGSTLPWEIWKSGQPIFCPQDSLGKIIKLPADNSKLFKSMDWKLPYCIIDQCMMEF